MVRSVLEFPVVALWSVAFCLAVTSRSRLLGLGLLGGVSWSLFTQPGVDVAYRVIVLTATGAGLLVFTARLREGVLWVVTDCADAMRSWRVRRSVPRARVLRQGLAAGALRRG